MELQTITNVAAIAGAATSPFAVWLAAKQTSLAHRQLNRGGGIYVKVADSGSVFSINGGPNYSPWEVTVWLEGPGERHNLELWLRYADEFRKLEKAPSPFNSSSPSLTASFDLTHEQQKKAYLFVTWSTEGRHGVIPQAVRFRLSKTGSSEYWKWAPLRHAWFRLFHHRFPKLCRFSLGKWCKTQNRPYSPQNLPTWPLGKPSKKLGELQPIPPEFR
ncbi:hypothetical protein [Corynebacterium sp. H113]|uniref:hypothetical protein n=1 Tax=Corynebacterium sp. H113 TaxID=3133419 RepID=UPI00309E5434